MKAKFCLICAAIVAGVLIFMLSCSDKPEIAEAISTNSSAVHPRTAGFSDPPELNGDRYEFRDLEHFQDHYEEASALYDYNGELFDSLIEATDEVNSVYVRLLEDEFEDPEDAYSPFLTDPITQSFVNEYFEFQIGDVLVTYINNEEVLTCDESDTDTRAEIRALDKGGRLDTADLPDAVFWGQDTDIESFQPPWCSCSIHIEYEDCNTLRISGSCRGYFWGEGDGVVKVWLRDYPGVPSPSTPSFLTESIDGNFEIFVDLSFLTEPKWVVAQINPNCITAQNKDVSLYFDPEGIVCDLGERNTGWQWDEENGQAFRSKTSYYANFFGSYELAEMESKYWNSSEAQWKPGQAKLEVTIDAYRRNDDCDQFLHEDETKDCNSCRKKYARINHGTYLGLGHCDGDVTGSFRKEIDNFVIDNEYSIDFECCL